MKIYTKTGDDGTTGLLGSRRVRKDDLRIEAYGTIDELNAVLGIARNCGAGETADAFLAKIQNELFVVGSALADPNPAGPFHSLITREHGQNLEAMIDILEAALPNLTQFILPGGTAAASQIHLARTVCRRAERFAVKLGHQPGEPVSDTLIIYLNRLGDALFVLARFVNQEFHVADVPWKGL